MALANMDDPELAVLPTHRVADAEGEFDADAFWEGLERYFTIGELPPGHPSDALADSGAPRFIVQTHDGRRRLVTLRADVDLDEAIPLPCSSAWKHLDVAVLQELVLSPLLGIHPDRPDTLDRLAFVKDAHQALKMGETHDVVFILGPRASTNYETSHWPARRCRRSRRTSTRRCSRGSSCARSPSRRPLAEPPAPRCTRVVSANSLLRP